MKIKVYIVTYKKNDILNNNLKTLWKTTKHPENIDVTILANHPDIEIYEENKRKNLKVVINTTRMPNSWGYLSRDWNYCILDCFKDYTNPNNVDWLLLVQNDASWVNNWDEWLESNKNYDLVSQPVGDQCIAMNINAVNKIGFFDERFTTLHFQEIDYFIRAIIRLNDRVSIYDTDSNLSIHSQGNVITNTNSSGINEEQTLHNGINWQESYNFILNKWGVCNLNIDSNYIKRNKKRLLKRDKNINWYPFFNKNLTYCKRKLSIIKKILKFFIKCFSCIIQNEKFREKSLQYLMR